MADIPDSDPAELTRAMARMMADTLAETNKAILSEHSAIGRWLAASLLAVNGAGALAVFNAADRLSHPSADSLFFAVGALSALAVGVLNQKANQNGGALVGEALARSVAVSVTGDYDAEQQEFADTFSMKIAKMGRWGPIAGWVSAALFGIGAVLTAADHPPTDPAQIARCVAIQRDMLSASPRRGDGPELFQALGCRSRGEGSVYAPRAAHPPHR